MQRGFGFEFHAHMRQRQRVAQWNQLGGLLGALNGGQARHAQYIALFGAAGHQHGEGVRLHADVAGGRGDAAGFGLAADIDHMGLAGAVKMGQFTHGENNGNG